MLKTTGMTLTLVVFLVSLVLSGCSACKIVTPLPVEVSIPIKNPAFASLFVAGETLELSASGHLLGGRYKIKSIPLDVPDDTSFSLSVRVPLHGSASVNLSEASGSFSSSRELKVYGLPVPAKLEFNKGKVSADILFVRFLCAFLIELVNQQLSPSPESCQNIGNILSDIQIPVLRLDLRPDAELLMPGARLFIGPGSSMMLADLKADRQFNYLGQFRAKINLRAGSQLKDEKHGLTVGMGAGHVLLNLDASSSSGVLKLETKEAAGAANEVFAQAVSLKAAKQGANCLLKFSSVAFNSAHCQSEIAGISAKDADIKADGKLTLSGTEAVISRPDSSVQFKVPNQLLASISYQQGDQGRSFHIESPAPIEANDVALALKRADGKISIVLDRASLSCSISSTPELVSFTLPKCDIKPRRLEWERGTRKLVMTMSAASRLSLSRDLHLALTPGSRVLEGPIPILLKDGSTTISGPKDALTLDGMNGSMTLDLKAHSTTLCGHLNTTIVEQSKAAGALSCGVRVGSIRIVQNEGHLCADLGDCRLTIPRATLEQMIAAKMQQTQSFKLNKQLLQNSHWRYRNFIVGEAQVGKLTLQQFEFPGTDYLSFSAAGDLLSRGTVERSDFNRLGLFKPNDSWKPLPWSASSHASGSGTVKLKLDPGKSLADSSLAYDAALMLALDNLKVDWTKVCGPDDKPGRADRAIVSRALKIANFCLSKDQLSLKRSGNFKLFAKPGKQLRSIKLEHPTLKASGDNLTVDFASHLEL